VGLAIFAVIPLQNLNLWSHVRSTPVIFFPTDGAGRNDDDYYYVEEYENPSQQQQSQYENNPIKVGHTFEMLPHPRIDKIGMSPLQLMAGDIANLQHESQVCVLTIAITLVSDTFDPACSI